MMASSLYVYTPAHLLPARLPFLLNRRLQPEVACQEVALEMLDFVQLGGCADQLLESGLSTTLHAPFSAFNPGSSKRKIRNHSLQMAAQSLLLAEKLHARRIVFHPGLAYGSDAKKVASWFENSLTFWPEFIQRAAEINCTLCIENIYATSPDILIRLLVELDSPHIGHVFDVGHWNIFGTGSLCGWLAETAPYLKHMHLHDNNGGKDEHLAVGQGTVPFSDLFGWLKTAQSPPTITLENHSLPEVEQSLVTLQGHFPEILKA
ncbi:Sugar phosphate isomerase/epimerase [Desulfuromusa kysingii]|uniref:Sugar phosphate isomerase/epimerase n=1 Tax=Desulfuromusa kysingii TaxID=37625 RepID=A0A1H4ARE6_9BACT|nr:sugar phosphate isomerase/epimerase family protein [Desulfuromusa kysingii]SEA38503.1 Sugar phosphate isomerase/epimerase [Desulfuromusa kysingii]